ncbi:MAG: response regulator [Deltaproteobacteria bacterium]|nr:response regulator [Deltaproteobacteria bacterium]
MKAGIPSGTPIAYKNGMTSMKVLIVDDNQLLCWGLGKTLSKRGIIHHAVENGTDALSEIRSAFYDLVFLDIKLPDANGLDLLPVIRGISPGTKVVVISSNGSESNVRRAMAAGAVRFMEKPYTCEELAEALEAVFPRKSEGKPASK